jgi:hypothetical protein
MKGMWLKSLFMGTLTNYLSDIMLDLMLQWRDEDKTEELIILNIQYNVQIKQQNKTTCIYSWANGQGLEIPGLFQPTYCIS